TSRALAAKYGFTLSNTGTGAAIYTVAQANWPAFGITSATAATQTISQLLATANVKAINGVLNNGNSTLITETSYVFNDINNQGDIAGGLTQVAAGSPNGTVAPLGRVYAGTYRVSVDGLQGPQA